MVAGNGLWVMLVRRAAGWARATLAQLVAPLKMEAHNTFKQRTRQRVRPSATEVAARRAEQESEKARCVCGGVNEEHTGMETGRYRRRCWGTTRRVSEGQRRHTTVRIIRDKAYNDRWQGRDRENCRR